jgi:VanZ family protein
MEYISKSKKKAIIISSWILVFLWMGFIFYMSAQDSTSSSGFSRPIAESVIKYQVKLHLVPQSKTTDYSYIDSVESTIRMIAHSTVFFILSVLVSLSLLLSDVKRLKVLFLSIALSLLYAFIDEFHQFFVPGRASEMLDICLDMFGILLGTTLTIIIGGLFDRKHRKRVTQKSKKLPAAHKDNKVIEFKPKQSLNLLLPLKKSLSLVSQTLRLVKSTK